MRNASTSLDVLSVSTCSTTDRAKAYSTDRMTRLTSGTCTGEVENSSSPIPSKSRLSGGSPAISPHIPTGIFAAWPTSMICLMRRRIAGVGGLIEIGDLLVDAVNSQRVLNQVIGANGEKVHLRRQEVAGHRRGGHFDHRPHLDLLGHRHSLLGELLAHLPEDFIGPAQLLQSGNHRIHQFQVPVDARAQD